MEYPVRTGCRRLFPASAVYILSEDESLPANLFYKDKINKIYIQIKLIFVNASLAVFFLPVAVSSRRCRGGAGFSVAMRIWIEWLERGSLWL